MSTGIPIEQRTPRLPVSAAMAFARSVWPVHEDCPVEMAGNIQAFYAWLDSLPVTHDRPWS